MEQKYRAPGYNIALTGFMGSGKSTVASWMEEHLGLRRIEMDEEIVRREEMSIPEIFRIHGEAYFRDCETELLRELGACSGTVISCGGGTVLRECNVAEIKKNGKIVFLTASPEVIYERVKNDSERPLLAGRKSPEGIRGLMEERRDKYEAAADVTVCTDGKAVPEICDEIIRKLREDRD